MYTEDLFAGPNAAVARKALLDAFAAWKAAAVGSTITRESSFEVYESMWNAFATWCSQQDPVVTLSTLDAADLKAFLNERKSKNNETFTTRHAWRVLSLVDRVQAYRARTEGSPYNDVAAALIEQYEALRKANWAENKAALSYLDGEEAALLVRYLREVRPGALGRRKLSGWEELRNLTAVALHLGAGLTPVDVRNLLVDAPVSAGGKVKGIPWKLHVPGNGNRPGREPPLARWAGELLLQWMEQRRELQRGWTQERLDAGLDADIEPDGKPVVRFLLPARRGKQWSKVAHFEGVQQVVKAVGIVRAEGGGAGLMLRHTYVLRQLKGKHRSREDLAKDLGITDPAELQRYDAVLYSPAEVV